MAGTIHGHHPCYHVCMSPGASTPQGSRAERVRESESQSAHETSESERDEIGRDRKHVSIRGHEMKLPVPGWLLLISRCPALASAAGARAPPRCLPATPSSVPSPCAQCHGRHPHRDDGVRLFGGAGHRRELLCTGAEIRPRVSRARKKAPRAAAHRPGTMP